MSVITHWFKCDCTRHFIEHSKKATIASATCPDCGNKASAIPTPLNEAPPAKPEKRGRAGS
ncbi:MAG: hypothetical protein JWR80_4988 [Bradyrhizobium sp.]|nr:hypothetical protein [Bradyrhizobium sp.]